MCVEHCNGHSIDKFPHSLLARKVISKYGAQKFKEFSDFCSPIDDIGGYSPNMLNISAAETVFGKHTVSFELVSRSLKFNDFKKLKELETDGKIYFVSDITDEIISELDMVISSCMYFYMLMLGYYNTRGKSHGCVDLYPENDTIIDWLVVLSNIDSDRQYHPILEVYSEVFISTSAVCCFEALSCGKNFVGAVETMLNTVHCEIDKRFLDFAEVTDELIKICSFLVKTAIVNNTYSIKIGE